jgi:hypothetical protein
MIVLACFRDPACDRCSCGVRVSAATYRIEIRRDPHTTSLPWDAVVYRVSDNARMTVCYGTNAREATDAAREWVRDEEGVEVNFAPQTLYVDDQGRDAEAPQKREGMSGVA